MSFSADVKKELSQLFATERHCNIAEIAAFINTSGKIVETDEGFLVHLQTENELVFNRFTHLLEQTFHIKPDVDILNSQSKGNKTFLVAVNDPVASEKILQATGLYIKDDEKVFVNKKVNSLVINLSCCKRAYIRGAFLAGGSVSDPEKAYHLEFVNSSLTLSEMLMSLINSFGLSAKIAERKNNYIVYLKESENIVDLLNIMQAHVLLMDFHNVRIIKDVRNKVNRLVNCETANLSKTVKASVQQIEDIQLINEIEGSNYLSENLLEVSRLRLKYPEASIKEIGEMLTPVVSKSGVNHRFRKISKIADNLRGGL